MKILENAERVLAIEILAACQGLEFLAPLKTSAPLEAARRALRRKIPRLTADRVLSEDIGHMTDLLRSGEILRVVERTVGALI